MSGANGAEARAEGVRIVALTDAWEGWSDLGQTLVPLKVRIENDSEHPLLVRYSEFQLVGPADREFAAIPPIEVDESGVEPVAGFQPYPSFGWDSYWIGPAYRPFYPDVPVYADAFPYEYGYYDRWYRAWDTPPSPMVISRALPEGVLEPGGFTTGFLYFDEVPESMEGVKLTAILVDARTKERFGRITIPFEVVEE